MSATAPQQRARRAPARPGFINGVLFNAVVLYVVNIQPGWRAAPFLTADTREVIGWVNISLVTAVVANLWYTLADDPWVRPLGGLVGAAVTLAALIRIWSVFPFDFSGSTHDWTLVTRTVLGISMGGAVIGILVSLILVVKALAARSRERAEGTTVE